MLPHVHMISGAFLGVTVAYFESKSCTGLAPLFGGLAAGMFGEIIPDINTESSVRASLPLLAKRIKRDNHYEAGKTHTLYIPVMTTAILILLMRFFSLPPVAFIALKAFALAYILHLLQDSFSSDYSLLFYPIIKKRISIIHTKIGGKMEFFIAALITAAFIKFMDVVNSGEIIYIIQLLHK